jgi:hypothetical protein
MRTPSTPSVVGKADGAARSRSGRSLAPPRRMVGRVAIALAIAVVALPDTGIAAPRHRVRSRPRAKISLLIRSTPTTVSVRQGRSSTSTIRATGINVPARSVSFRVYGLPRGAAARFTPSSPTPAGASRMIVTASSRARVGSYTVRVVATTITVRSHRKRRQSRIRALTARPVPLHVLPAHKSSDGRASTTTPVSVPSHIATWAYDDACGGGQGTGASASLAHQWLTYAESNCSNDSTKVLSDCHANGVTYCTAIQYVDANWIYAQGSLPVAASAQESWWLHQPGYTDSAHRLSTSAYGGGNILNQSNPAVASWFQNYVRTNYNSYDALMMDDTSGSLSNLTWGSGSSTSREITSDTQLQAAHAQMAAAMTHTNGQPFLQIDNGLSPNNNLSTPFPMLNDTTGLKGVLTEGSPIANGTLISYYSTLLDEMAYVNQTANNFVVLLSYDPSGSPQARRVQAASVLLGYSPGHTVSWSDLETNSSNLAVWPEEGIVPTNPIQTMTTPSGTDCLTGHGVICSTGGHTTIQVAPHIYRREFAACYNRSAPIGRCAAIVNTTNSPATVRSTWLTQAYAHQITMTDGDVQSGGTINLTGSTYTPNSTTVPPNDAVLLSR